MSRIDRTNLYACCPVSDDCYRTLESQRSAPDAPNPGYWLRTQKGRIYQGITGTFVLAFVLLGGGTVIYLVVTQGSANVVAIIPLLVGILGACLCVCVLMVPYMGRTFLMPATRDATQRWEGVPFDPSQLPNNKLTGTIGAVTTAQMTFNAIEYQAAVRQQMALAGRNNSASTTPLTDTPIRVDADQLEADFAKREASVQRRTSRRRREI